MANKDPSRTEKPTAKRINEARKKGQVLMSPEVVSLAVVAAGALSLFVTMPLVHDAFSDILRAVLQVDCRRPWTSTELFQGTVIAALQLGRMVAPTAIFVCVAACTAIYSQIGYFFETKPLEWKLDKLNPIKGFKKIVPSKDNTIKLLLVLCKVLVIGYVVYLTLRGEIGEIVGLMMQPVSLGVRGLLRTAALLAFKILAIFIVVATLDYIHKWRQYYDSLMMTKQEIKDEHKNSEGNPQIKGKIRQKMRAMTFMKMVSEVPQADVVVTNPTHVAVALKYKFGDFAPRVVAKGLRKRAHRIKQIANDAGVPIVEAPPLARALYRTTPLGGFIPGEFFSAVAAILAKLQQAGKRQFMPAGMKVK